MGRTREPKGPRDTAELRLEEELRVARTAAIRAIRPLLKLCRPGRETSPAHLSATARAAHLALARLWMAAAGVAERPRKKAC